MVQPTLFGDDTVSENIRAIDDLLARTTAYRRSQAYWELIQFLAKFTHYSPYNAFLLHVQNPKVTFVATPTQWQTRHGRWVKPNSHPLLILAPMHPILFVYDLADTEGRPLPKKLLDPFVTVGEIPPIIWKRTEIKARKDGILTMVRHAFSNLQAGEARKNAQPTIVTNEDATYTCQFTIMINAKLPKNAQYATLVHELGHIYAGHLGEVVGTQIPDRSFFSSEQREIEAETIAYLVCKRLGIQTASEEYLALKAQQDIELPKLSLDTILKVAGRIESMGKT